MLTGLLTTLAPGLFKIIDKIIPDPEAREKAKMELAKMQQQGELKELETQMSAIVMEAKSKDPWTSRARPSFLYVIYIIILSCFIGGIVGIWFPAEVMQAATNIKALLSAVPEWLWAMFGAGYLGYAKFRSDDKKNILSAMGTKN